ncbi:MAG: acyl--CoA ligase [Halioglobus sp.]|nr:acyl--CoA ligase [Halioglobus sp.]
MSTIAAQLEQARTQLTQPGAPFELTTVESNGVNYRAFKNAPQTLAQLAESSRKLGDKCFLVYEDERWSYERFFQHVDALAQQLVYQYEIGKGDRVAVAMRNYPEWMTAFIAIVSIGGVAVPLNSWGSAGELAYGLENAQARLVFCDQPRLEAMLPTLQENHIQAVVVRAKDSDLGAAVAHYSDMVKAGSGQQLPRVALSPDDMALILYTSGTTGRPKGALSEHRNVCQAIFNLSFAAACAAIVNPDTIAKMTASGFEPSSLLCVPLFHVSGCHSVFLVNLFAGRKIAMMHKWDADKALHCIERERITTFAGVPTMVRQLMEAEGFDKADTSSLFGMGGGGAASPPQLAELIYSKKPYAFAGTGYGLTETNASGASSTGAAYRQKPTSAGTLSPIVELEIRDEDGAVLDSSATGHIWLKGISLMCGYWDAATATAQPLQDGWFNTEDIGYVDDEGFLFLVDRAKDMIIRGGENIYAAEIEGCISGHPAVNEVVAFGVPHDVLGEELAVVVHPRDNCTIDENTIRSYVAQNLAKFKVPAHVLISPEELPKNATGKLQKKVVRAAFIAQHKS